MIQQDRYLAMHAMHSVCVCVHAVIIGMYVHGMCVYVVHASVICVCGVCCSTISS